MRFRRMRSTGSRSAKRSRARGFSFPGPRLPFLRYGGLVMHMSIGTCAFAFTVRLRHRRATRKSP